MDSVNSTVDLGGMELKIKFSGNLGFFLTMHWLSHLIQLLQSDSRQEMGGGSGVFSEGLPVSWWALLQAPIEDTRDGAVTQKK